jgi:hypothetical protein
LNLSLPFAYIPCISFFLAVKGSVQQLHLYLQATSLEIACHKAISLAESRPTTPEGNHFHTTHLHKLL